MPTLLLRAALKRGFLLVLANWRVVLIDFTAESFRKFAMAVPVIGGVLMVGALIGDDATDVLSLGVVTAAERVLDALTSTPLALASFLGALTLVTVAGQAVSLIIRAGTLGVLVDADRRAGEAHRLPIGIDALSRARAFDGKLVVARSRHFGRRMVALSVLLGGTYLLMVLAYLGVARVGLSDQGALSWLPAWSLVMVLSTSAGVVILACAHLVFDLVRVVIVTDDCGIGVALARVRRFIVEDARQVIGIFSVISGVEIVAGATAVLAAAGLTPMAYLPLLGFVVLPLQAALWLVRGLVFESLKLASVSAYQTQYRRFGEGRWSEPASTESDAYLAGGEGAPDGR
jgi:hypothetical protein